MRASRPNEMRVEVHGLDGLQDRLMKAAEDVKRAAAAAIAEELEAALQEARANVPVRTGALQKSIRTEAGESGMSGRLIAGGKKAPHAHLVEFGTRKAAPHAFLFPAGESARQRLSRRMKRLLGES